MWISFLKMFQQAEARVDFASIRAALPVLCLLDVPKWKQMLECLDADKSADSSQSDLAVSEVTRAVASYIAEFEKHRVGKYLESGFGGLKNPFNRETEGAGMLTQSMVATKKDGGRGWVNVK